MTRGEASKLLNGIFEALDTLEGGTRAVPRALERLNMIRDTAVLLALDLGLPVKPMGIPNATSNEKSNDKNDNRRPGETG